MSTCRSDLCAEGTCYCVPGGTAERKQAIRDLLRPWEVAHLFAGPVDPWMIGIVIADWMARAKTNGWLRYRLDPQNCDRWCSPKVTLREGAGDCDDLAITCAALVIKAGGYAVVAFGHVWNGREWIGHAWVEGSDLSGPFMIEATTGQLFLERPSTYRHVDAQGFDAAAAANAEALYRFENLLAELHAQREAERAAQEASLWRTRQQFFDVLAAMGGDGW